MSDEDKARRIIDDWKAGINYHKCATPNCEVGVYYEGDTCFMCKERAMHDAVSRRPVKSQWHGRVDRKLRDHDAVLMILLFFILLLACSRWAN